MTGIGLSKSQVCACYVAFNIRNPPNTHPVIEIGLGLCMLFACQVASNLRRPLETHSVTRMGLCISRLFFFFFCMLGDLKTGEAT